MSILRELYLGNIRPNEWDIAAEADYAQALHALVDAEERLMLHLSEEGKRLFREYQLKQLETVTLNEQHAFESGFKMGANVMLELRSAE